MEYMHNPLSLGSACWLIRVKGDSDAVGHGLLETCGRGHCDQLGSSEFQRFPALGHFIKNHFNIKIARKPGTIMHPFTFACLQERSRMEDIARSYYDGFAAAILSRAHSHIDELHREPCQDRSVLLVPVGLDLIRECNSGLTTGVHHPDHPCYM